MCYVHNSQFVDAEYTVFASCMFNRSAWVGLVVGPVFQFEHGIHTQDPDLVRGSSRDKVKHCQVYSTQ